MKFITLRQYSHLWYMVASGSVFISNFLSIEVLFKLIVVHWNDQVRVAYMIRSTGG